MTKNKRLIAFINSCSRFKTGGDMVFIEMAKRLDGYYKIIITPSIGKDLCRGCGLEGEYIITTRNEKSEFGNVILTYIRRTLKAFLLRLKVEKGDILLATSDFFPDVLPVLWLKFRNKNVKWVQHIFHLIPRSRLLPFLSQRISLFLIKYWADLVVVDNSLLKNKLVNELGFALKKTIVNHPGIDLNYLKKIKSIKKKSGYDAVFMAQIRPSKGIFDLVEIWKLVVKKNSKLKLGVIGRGKKDIVDKLKKLIRGNSLKKNIKLLGYLPDDEAYSTIRSSHIFISPSHEEGFGIAMLEAQALGLPVVAWRLPVFDEVFKSGMIKIKIGDKKEFAQKILDLLTSEGLYQKMVREAVQNAERYSWQATADRQEKFFKKING